ncbi:MAG TPA: neutral zinc metallopeptidase [Propionicimonas sp.]|nr:neutral zinc metallopeptidase [Propionicimonas sp.]
MSTEPSRWQVRSDDPARGPPRRRAAGGPRRDHPRSSDGPARQRPHGWRSLREALPRRLRRPHVRHRLPDRAAGALESHPDPDSDGHPSPCGRARTQPRLHRLGSGVQLTVCGLLGVEFPALYCPLDSTLYFSAEAWRESSYYRLATAELALHEYAHHVQRLAGIYDVLLAASDTVRGLQRRVELQAHCLAMYELASSDIGLSASDVSDLEYQFAWPGDVEGHGSARAKTRWGRRGLGATTAGACNTWTASGDEVR